MQEKTKQQKKYSALQETLERLLTGTTWLKVSNITDEGGRHVGNICHWWDFLGGRGETPLPETGTPNIISPYFDD